MSAWIALEVLSPQTYRKPADLADGDFRRIADLAKFSELPWERGEKSRPYRRLFYQVVLGAIVMEGAAAKLLEIYTDEDIERVSASGFAPIAILTVDNKGLPVEPNAIAISSFAWGLPFALRQKLSALGDWPRVEHGLVEGAERLIRPSDDQEVESIDKKAIERVFKHIVQKLALPEDCIVSPEFAVRVYQWFAAPEPPDPPPMGSFFLSDLAKAKSLVQANSIPETLERYLALSIPSKLIDLRQDDVALAEAVAPQTFPLGSWPAESGNPLVLLQQAAVNLALSNTMDTTLTPVNGPPGTGKTTLLRDLVVALIVQRARAMATFDNPNDAFNLSNQKFRSGNALTQPYQINTRLMGFEIVVASSNNKAVENVSAELPTLSAINISRNDLRYFKSVADNVARGMKGDNRDETDGAPRSLETAPPELSESWGLIAAVLGNARNRFAFRQNAWSDADYGLRTYLMEASGNPQSIEVKDPKSGRVIEKRKPYVVSAEKPPASAHAALERWRFARNKFIEASRKIDERFTILEKARQALESNELMLKRRALGERLTELERKKLALREAQARLELAIAGARSSDEELELTLAKHNQRRPSPISRIIGSSAYVEWDQIWLKLLQSQREHRSRLDKMDRALAEGGETEKIVGSELIATQRNAMEVEKVLESLTQALNKAAEISGRHFVDAAFFERSMSDVQRDAPWLDRESLRLREDVFVAAMDLHKAFVDAAAKQIRSNLDLLFRAFFGRNGWSDRLRPLMPGLWTTFFCVVPVVSTTFASVERMFGYLDPKAFGWLLIDEAGQAVPQAAVGALTRARRAVIVGDPLQLPPITSLPSELAHKIADQYGVDQGRFIAPAASVQTLADTSSVYGTTVVSVGENVRVGIPLVVHRRCAEPMFSLSNNLAYGGMMVQGRGDKHSKIREVLGPSAWIDVRPDRCEDKWSAAEGRAVVELFRKLNGAELEEIDIYIVSPFRIVAQKLRQLLISEKVLSRWTKDPWIWTRDRVGTVYTVQGRQADTIILVLGAAEPQRHGARNWAGEGVNQLNVAVTRAKENLYVIGNRFEWASAGNFAALEGMFP
ncbi:MAG: AAA domain-containing protein [Xanthobacteraceae bacterium]